jgi:hypothetical protein
LVVDYGKGSDILWFSRRDQKSRKEMLLTPVGTLAIHWQSRKMNKWIQQTEKETLHRDERPHEP